MATASTAALGQWANAPLALVLAQVRFEQILDLDNLVLQVNTQLSQLFPRLSKRLVFPLGAPVGAHQALGQPPAGVPSSTVYQFANAETTKSIRIESNSLTYTVSRYQDYAAFADELATILQAFVGASGKPLFVNRLGLRYVDFIVPSEGREPSDYIKAPVGQMPVLGKISPAIVLNLAEYPFDGGVLRLQYLTGNGMPSLLDDLQPTPVALAPRTLLKDDQRTAVLDFDRISHTENVLSVEDILASFETMHADMSMAFMSMITDFAKISWNPGT